MLHTLDLSKPTISFSVLSVSSIPAFLSMAETNSAPVLSTKSSHVLSTGSSNNPHDSFSGADDPIPIIDYSMLLSEDLHLQSKTIEDLRKACLHYGSFVIINHGLPESLIRRVSEAWTEFFDLMDDEKRQYETNDPTDRIRWGKRYTNYQSWEFVKMALYPTFYCPDKPVGLKETMQEYHKRAKEVGIQLLRGISKTLGLEGSFIEKRIKMESGFDLCVPNDYPPRLHTESRVGQFPHYDPGLLILLLQSAGGGLQIEHQGKWLNASPQPNSITVIIADNIEILTNGKYKSVLHRVILNNDLRRISLPLFIGPALDTIVSPLPEFVNEQNPPGYLMKTYKELLTTNQYHQIDVKSGLKNIRL